MLTVAVGVVSPIYFFLLSRPLPLSQALPLSYIYTLSLSYLSISILQAVISDRLIHEARDWREPRQIETLP